MTVDRGTYSFDATPAGVNNELAASGTVPNGALTVINVENSSDNGGPVLAIETDTMHLELDYLSDAEREAFEEFLQEAEQQFD